MATANGTKTTHKRPITIYDCTQDQHAECDYKYLARVWFFRTLAIVVVSGISVVAGVVWNTGIWKTQQENEISNVKSTLQIFDNRITKVETMESNIDTLKEWLRPKKD